MMRSLLTILEWSNVFEQAEDAESENNIPSLALSK